MPDHSAWTATWNGLGVEAPGDHLYEELIARYSSPERHYHTLQHLDECFARLAESGQLAEHVHEIELALWFHDASYPTASSARSAAKSSKPSSRGRVFSAPTTSEKDSRRKPGSISSVQLQLYGTD